jgi:cell division protein FtsB
MPTRSPVRDLTRPVHVDNKLFQRAISRNITLTVSVVILVALAVALIGLPVKGLMSQRGDITQRQQEFAALEDANEQLQTEIQRLQTPEGIRETARKELGYLLPGEKRLALLEAPALDIALPAGWPYNLVTNILTVRAAAAQKNGIQQPGSLGPLLQP